MFAGQIATWTHPTTRTISACRRCYGSVAVATTEAVGITHTVWILAARTAPASLTCARGRSVVAETIATARLAVIGSIKRREIAIAGATRRVAILTPVPFSVVADTDATGNVDFTMAGTLSIAAGACIARLAHAHTRVHRCL
jgi:hypothetical protein